MSRRRKKIPQDPIQADIISLSHEGRGIAKINGKTTFIRGALPGETVMFKYTHCLSKYDEGAVTEVLTAAKERVIPPCIHADMCGGCSIQHISTSKQIEIKSQLLDDHLRHFATKSDGALAGDTRTSAHKSDGGTTDAKHSSVTAADPTNTASVQHALLPKEKLQPLTGPTTGYRRKARLGVRYVHKKETVLVGFREAGNSRFITDIDSCVVLDRRVGQLITPLKTMLNQLEAKRHIPQIEVAMGDTDTALIIRHLEPLADNDLNIINTFAEQHALRIYLQPGKMDSIHLFTPQDAGMRLSYQLPDFGLTLRFHPADFTQVNADINKKMVSKAVELLALSEQDSVLDLFCGLGNFTFAIAKQAKDVVGVEGSQQMVERGYENAKYNNIDNAEFYAADLTQDVSHLPWAKRAYNKVLIDPPRSGALEILPLIVNYKPSIIVYVSCNPATLARDAGELVNQYGYTLEKAGVMDMFPHTSHVESIAVFKKA